MSSSRDADVPTRSIRASGRVPGANASIPITRGSAHTERIRKSGKAQAKTGKQKLAATDKRKRPQYDEPKPRTRTSEVRRSEIDLLQKESKFLEAKVEFLKHRAGVFDEQTLSQQVLDNALCREFLRNQNLSMAGLKSAIATDASDHFPSPLSTRIVLGSDPIERHEFLFAVKPQKIHDARQYLERRTQFLDMTRRFSDTNQFETADGEICSTKLDVVPLYNAVSVKQVYDVLRYYVQNVEISTAEINGDVALREEAETGDESIWLNRLVFLKKEFGVNVENSNAVFCEYSPPATIGAERSDELGLITIDFVDEDELYPYRPSERLRDNVTAAIMVKSYRLLPRDCSSERANQSSDLEIEENQEEVVVLTRWVQAKFQRGESSLLSDDALFELRRDSDRVSDAVLSLVRARFGSSTPSLLPTGSESAAVTCIPIASASSGDQHQ